MKQSGEGRKGFLDNQTALLDMISVLERDHQIRDDIIKVQRDFVRLMMEMIECPIISQMDIDRTKKIGQQILDLVERHFPDLV